MDGVGNNVGPKVLVIDGIPGCGKSTYILDYMNKNPDKKWLFVSPYLDEVGDGGSREVKEIGRIQKECPSLKFKSPSSTPSKSRSFLRLAKAGHNIACTHSLFQRFTEEIAQVLREQGYHLVIDETIDLVAYYDSVKGDDVRIMMNSGFIELEEGTNRLRWTVPEYNGRDMVLKELCDNGCLFLCGEDVLIQRIPPNAMRACQSVTILTYMFEASLMCAWMKINNLEWEYFTPDTIKSNSEIKEIIRPLLHIVPPTKAIIDMQRTERGLYNRSVFNYTWYEKYSEGKLEQVKKSIESTLKTKMPKGDVFWTTFADWQLELQGVGYTRGKKIDGNIRPTFVAKNKRASNEYRDCINCIYTINIYPNGSLESHLASMGIILDRDMYALSELIQFVFRGRIRQHKEMYVLILSERMLLLLEEWLKTDF